MKVVNDEMNEWMNGTTIANVFTYWFRISLMNEWMNE